jgi:hypothetical protein
VEIKRLSNPTLRHMESKIEYLAKFIATIRTKCKRMSDSPRAPEADQPEMPDSLKPLLIQSIGRSGTTLLMQLMGTSPQVVFDRVYPFEVRYLTYLLHWAQMLEQDCDQDNHWDPNADITLPGQTLRPFPYKGSQLWNGEELWPKCFQAAWREFSRIAIARARAKCGDDMPLLYYAEKTPRWVPILLRGVVPYNALLLVRDPRDIFLSITAFDKKRGFPGFNRRANDDDWSFAKRFVDECREPLKIIREEEAYPHNVLVKYECLVLNSPNESQRLSQRLGVQFDIGVVENQTPEFVHHMTSNTARESVERWRRELPAELNEFFLTEFREELQHFGYET